MSSGRLLAFQHSSNRDDPRTIAAVERGLLGAAVVARRLIPPMDRLDATDFVFEWHGQLFRAIKSLVPALDAVLLAHHMSSKRVEPPGDMFTWGEAIGLVLADPADDDNIPAYVEAIQCASARRRIATRRGLS